MSWTGLGAILTSIRKRASARYEKDIIIYQALFETNGHRPFDKVYRDDYGFGAALVFSLHD